MESDEKETFRYIVKRKEPCSIKEIYTALRITEYRMRQIIAILESKDLIRKIGNGRGTRYTRAETSIEELTSRQIEVDRYKKQLT